MDSTLAPLVVLALTVVALIVGHGRSLLARMAVEAGLLLAIGAFLAWRMTSPVPFLGSVPVGLADTWVRALAVIWWLIGARLVVNITVFIRRRDQRARNARLFSDLAAAVIYITAGLIILNSILDLNIRGLLVTSGVVAIVLGLALQSTLADVFAGIAVGMERPFQVGDEVAVGDGINGAVVQINWRSIRIQTDGDDLATVPNGIVSKAVIINRSAPTLRRAASVQIVVPTSAASDMIIDLMQQATLLCTGILPTPSPVITIRRSGLLSATYAASFSVSGSPDLAATKSMFLRQARRLFRHAGIGRDRPITQTELLKSLPPFQTLSSQELEDLIEALAARSVEPGDIVFNQGDPGDSLYVIEAGVMAISRCTPRASEEPLGRIGAGEYIGELGLVAGSPRAFTVKALTHGRVLELPGDAVRRLLQSNTTASAMMDRAVNKGLASIERADAPDVTHPPKPADDLLERAKAFLGL